VEAFPRKVLVRHLLDLDAKITRTTAPDARVTGASHRDVVSFHHAGRDRNRDGLLSLHPSFAATLCATVRDDPTFTLTHRTGLHVHELSEDGTSHLMNLTRAAAGLARLVPLGPVFSTRTGAGIARDVLPDLDLLLRSLSDLLEGQGKLDAEITAGPPLPTRATGTGPRPEHLVEDRTGPAKDVGKRAEDVVYVLETRPGTTGAISTNTGVAETVVTLALLRVREHFVCFRRFLETLFGLCITRVAVRVILHRQLPVGFLQLRGIRSPAYTQYLVII